MNAIMNNMNTMNTYILKNISPASKNVASFVGGYIVGVSTTYCYAKVLYYLLDNVNAPR